MAWQILKPPNGLLARFSDVTDHFTHWDMTVEEAVDVCKGEGLFEGEAQRKVQAGVDDIEPWTTTKPGTGLSRWGYALEAIRRVHGSAERDRYEEELSTPPDGDVDA